MDSKRLRTSEARLINCVFQISKLPVDILYFIISLLSIKEAARTSILSRGWRYLWKTSLATFLSLHLDVLRWENSLSYPAHEFGHDSSMPTSYYRLSRPSKTSRPTKTHRFVGHVLQVLNLHHASLRHALRIRFYLENGYARHDVQWMNFAITQTNEFVRNTEQWIQVAIANTCQNTKSKSHLVIKREIYRHGNLYYLFPRFFSNHTLKPCSIRTTSDSHLYHSLVDLRLKRVKITKETIDTILSDCPNLEYLLLHKCSGATALHISGTSLKIKLLVIASYCLQEIVIDAENLTQFHYVGGAVKLLPINVPSLSNMLFKPRKGDLSYARGNLSTEFPHLESLVISVVPMEEKKLPRHLPLFRNLKKLRLLVETRGETLWGFIPLLQASPYLRLLEFALEICDEEFWESKAIGTKNLMNRPCDFSHPCLEEIVLGGFTGSSPHEVEFATYLLNTATNLRKLLIFANCPRFCYHFSADLFPSLEKTIQELSVGKGTDTNKGAWEELRNLKHPGLEIVFAD